MPKLVTAPPYSLVEPVTEVLHGVTITDQYRWLEDRDSPRTGEWLQAQREHARSYLDSIPGRDRIHERIRELLDVKTYDSVQKVGERYFFRKRLPGQEQFCIYYRQGAGGKDQLLIDPAERGTGPYTAVKPLQVSPDSQLLLYEVKEGGERTGTFELFDIENHEALPDILSRGYLRGFAFAQDSKSFYYVHEPLNSDRPYRRVAFQHALGTSVRDDQEVFVAGESQNLRLCIVAGETQLGFLVFRFLEKTLTDFYLWPMGSACPPEPIIEHADYKFRPILLKDGRILAITDREAPNFKVVEVHPRLNDEPHFIDVVPTSSSAIQNWVVAGARIFVSYIRELKTQIDVLDLTGKWLSQLPVEASDTVRLMGTSDDGNELFLERESFTNPIQICSCSLQNSEVTVWAERTVPFASAEFSHSQIWFTAKDGVRIPMFLVGRPGLLEGGSHPTIMTSYGGYGVPMTPQFSVFVAFLMERGCLFALPSIRGGSELGVEWHHAAKRQNRQIAVNDFLAAAQWLIESGRTDPRRFAIFGGSNSGLLVGAAMTQRPELFCAVVCMVPILDMLRYHLFDNAHVWQEEFGTADDAEDFAALLGYSPYHNVQEGTAYPAIMMVSGDSDQNCNPLHARKMTARLQAANISASPIFLDYCRHRGHSPVLPLSQRLEALTDRMAFLCNQLGLNL